MQDNNKVSTTYLKNQAQRHKETKDDDNKTRKYDNRLRHTESKQYNQGTTVK